MKRIQSSIETKINAYISDNKVTGMVSDYLLSDLNQDSDYWWFLEDDDDDKLTPEDRKMVEDYIRNNYEYRETRIDVDLDNLCVHAYGYEHRDGYDTDPDLEIEMQEKVDMEAEEEGLGNTYEVQNATYYEEDDCWSARLIEII